MNLIERATPAWVLTCVAAWASSSCGQAGEQSAASSEAHAEVAPPHSASADPSASAAAATLPPKPRLLALARAFPEELKGLQNVYQLNGHLLIVDGSRVLRVNGQKLDLVADHKGESPFGGEAMIRWIGGTYPDAIDVIGQFNNGRAPLPHVGPLTGKGESTAFGGGGGYGYVAGVGYRDGSAVIIGKDMSARRIVTIRGKPIPLTQTGRVKVGCAAEKDHNGTFVPAIDAETMGSSKDGTIISLGEHCGGPHTGVEVWPREGEAKVIKLTDWQKSASYSARILSGADRAWIVGVPEEPILELKNLAVRALPKLAKHVHAFVGPDDTLYASDGKTLHHLAGSDAVPAWQPVANLIWPTHFETMVLHDGVFWGSTSGVVFKLVPGEPIELGESCKTPFVHLFDVSAGAEPGYSFPTTKKALQAVERKKEIALVEFQEGGRRLGVKVPDRAAGEQVVNAIKLGMKDEAPRLICYEPSRVLRTHPL